MNPTLKNILIKVLGPLLLSKSKVVATTRISDHLMLLKIKGRSLKKANWIPGQKVTVQISEKDMRSYTPMKWDKADQSFETLVYLHNKGPLSKWANGAKLKSKVTIMGPRASLVIDETLEHFIFFGDETTFGLCYALINGLKQIKQNYFLESTHFEDSKKALNYLGLLERKEINHFPLNNTEVIAQEILKLHQVTDGRKKIILSGKQQNIVKIRTFLTQNGIKLEDIIVKVYWGWKDDPNGKLSK